MKILFLLLTAALLQAKPNIIIFLADDQGWGDVGHHGNSDLQTPYLDSLARDGVSFERFFVSTVCAPTRAAFFTGRYAPRTGVTGVSTGRERLNIDELTFGEIFKSAGYTLGAFGKWHNGTQYPNHPNARGWDEFYGFTSGHWGHYFSPQLDHNGTVVRGEGFLTDDLTNHAIEFIKEKSKGEQPFVAYLPYCTPHSPMQVPDEFWDRFENKELKMENRDPKKEKSLHKRAALAMVENIDWNVGRVLKTLEELNLSEETIVIYFSDNGPNGWRWNGGMAGKKGSLDEGGVRVPFFIRWPGQLPAGKKVTPIASAIDILPTLTDLTNIERAEPKPIDGVSLKPLLVGKADIWPRRSIFSTWNNRFGLRTSQFRLSDKGRLFDMIADPGQTNDLSEERPQLLKALKKELSDFRATLPKREERGKARPFLVGYHGSKYTQLPARDGLPKGGVKRSSIHPNCSFFQNWTSKEDRIVWEVEVATEGEYQVELHYTCPANDIGSTIELSFLGEKVTGVVSEAHDPPLIGAEQDRSPRTESLVKDFQLLKLGNIYLKKSSGEIILRAKEIAGKKVMDLRLLTLRNDS